MSGIYIASKTCHADKWLALRASGVPIISTWIDEAGPGQTKSWTELFDRCVSEASNAASLVLYCEPGETLKGALVEVGAALAHGVPVFWVGPRQNCTSHPLVMVCESLDAALEWAHLAIEERA